MENRRRASHFVLVHGSGHGAWCWYKVTALLRSAGHRVTAPDLAACGVDERKLSDVATFAEYAQPLIEIMRAVPPEEKVILVGHSFGGMSLALAMEMFRDKIAAAVFVTAVMPGCRHPPSYVLEKCGSTISWMDCKLNYHGDAKFPSSVLFGPQYLQAKLYQLSSPEDVTLASTLVRQTSFFLQDLQQQPPFSEHRYGSVDAVYIICSQDLSVTEDFQRWMIENHPLKEVKSIEAADHMAMLSTPKELFQSLLDIANTYA